MSVRQRCRRILFRASACTIAHAPEDLQLLVRHLRHLVSFAAPVATFGVGTVHLTDVAVGHVSTFGG